jgi:uncharacterized membrane protein
VPDRIPRWAPWATLPLAVLGLGLSGYLTYVHYTEPTALACPATATINCTKVTTSAQSTVLGVPVALGGAIFFLALVVLMLPAAWKRATRAWTATRVGAVTAGMAMVLWLVYAEAVVLHTWCLWCTAVHIVMFALFVVVLAAVTWGEPRGQQR